jgi:Putative S-adenosyl-L-methionine-dependent methyltransferase
MRQVLTNPNGGYYTTRDEGSEIFGKTGDFITSPEIIQVFGELIGIWTVAEWMAQGRVSSGVELIEVGPGKGTLMADILRVSSCGVLLPLRRPWMYTSPTLIPSWLRRFEISRALRRASRWSTSSKLALVSEKSRNNSCVEM